MARSTNSNAAKYESLVMSLATGVSVSEWCRQNETAPSTVGKWQSEPEFTRNVREFRQNLLHLAVGKFTGAVNPTADGMIKRAGFVLLEPTALSAQRAMMDNLAQITEFAELKKDVEVLRRWVAERRAMVKEMQAIAERVKAAKANRKACPATPKELPYASDCSVGPVFRPWPSSRWVSGGAARVSREDRSAFRG